LSPSAVSRFAADDGDLVAEGLACRRGERMVFVGLDVGVPAGGALVLTGPNGSGKSSLLRLLALLLLPAAGEIRWGPLRVADDPAEYRRRLHYAGHLDAIKPSLAVEETLALWAATRDATQPHVEAALAAFGLDRLRDLPCRWLSAGQRRRLALARLLAAPAPLWLLDEPTASLDADGEARLMAALAAHRAEGGRVVIATHQRLALPDAAALSLEPFAAGAAAAPGDSLAGF